MSGNVIMQNGGITVSALLADRHVEKLQWNVTAHVDKWTDEQTEWVRRQHADRLIRSPQAADFAAAGIAPHDTADCDGNLVTTAGLNRLTALLMAAGGQALTATATRLGVGNGSGTAAVGDTDLSAAAGAANRQFNIMDGTYPQQANGVFTARATYATGDANFAWNEWGLDVGTPTVANGTTVAALLFNHKTSAALGTKASGSWTLTVTVTIA